MKPYRGLLILLGVATLGAFGWHQLADDPGYLLLTWRGWSVETTLAVALVGLALVALLLWLLGNALRAPWRWWHRGRRRAARARFADGLLALHDGRWARAEKLLARAAGDAELRLPALLYASRAARERGQPTQADALLERAGRAGGVVAAALPEAERLLADQRAGTACELLDQLDREHTLPPKALELRARALAAAGRTDEAVALLPALRRSQVRDGDRWLELETELLRSHLAAADTASELAARWSALDRSQRLRPLLVAAYASRAARLGEADAAADAIERALAKQWSEPLVRLYGELPHRAAALKTAEHWLERHPDDPDVLLCLGRLCRREQLWGKAEAYLGRAIARGAGGAAWEALAEVFADQSDDSRARQAYANALAATRHEPVRPLLQLPKPGPEPTDAEERNAMGLPRLPASNRYE